MQHTPPHVCLYIQTKHLFTEQGTIEIQMPPYMEETYLWGELNTANHTELQQHCRTDPHRWPIYRQSFLQNPSHWWPGTCTGPGPPPWFDRYGGPHLRLTSQYLSVVEDGFSPQDAAKATRMRVCGIGLFFFYLIHTTEHVHPCTMLWWGVGCLERDSEESTSCSCWRCNRSNYEAAPEAPKLEGKAHTPWKNEKKLFKFFYLCSFYFDKY